MLNVQSKIKISKQIISQIENEAKKYFQGASGCHDWKHVERVYNLARHIGREEKADLPILAIAAFLHDIGRKEEMKSRGRFCHAEKGADLAKKILEKYDLEKSAIDNILHCIISHRFRNDHLPETIEAKVLYDADKLDSIGAVGIARDFLFAGYLGHALYTGNELAIARSGKDHSYLKDDTGILEYEIKLKKIKNKMLTQTGKKLAEARHDFMVNFFKTFWLEVRGLK
ncbi:MAG: HD domain-containing protein [Patescibacteria group bacterium]|nr:HD domain-containing protein [Patescibacteria group bacterium]MDD4611280.1 HD domain-containing protein [Patescibacteria group bacterium]